MPAPYFLETLGVPRLVAGSTGEVKIRTRKHLALLVVLAVEHGRVRRDYLLEMLWPNSPPHLARGSLATAVSFLRSRLGPGSIRPARELVELNSDLITLDLDRLAKGDILGDGHRPPLQVDAFLAGFEIPGLPEFERWKERHNARLLPSIERALIELAAHAKKCGNLPDLAKHADRLLQLNDLSEAGMKARMEAYALSGDRITALRIYDEWQMRLRDEVAALPGSDLEALATRLRRRTWDLAPATALPPPVETDQWRNQVFVGRAREYRRLYDAWESVKTGNAHHVIITGDSGVGKTTLADRFATSVALEGATVARVRCFDLERGIPYAMLGGILESLIDRPGAVATSPDALAELGRLIPEVRRRYPTLPLTTHTTGDSARLRFAEAAQALLRSVLEENAVLIVVDDADQSDDVSAGLMHFLLRRLAHSPLMVVFTQRADCAPTPPSHLRTSAVTRATVEVAPLSHEECNLLLTSLLQPGTPPPTATERRTLIAGCGGYPLAMEMLLRDWQVRGRASVGFAVRSMATTIEDNGDARYNSLTDAVLLTLDDTDRVVLYIAAILDRRIGDLPLYGLAGISPARVLSVLSQMIARRVLRDTGAALEWVNPTLRMHVYLRTPPSLRRSIHSRIADELVLRGDDREANGLEIAWHLHRAGRSIEGAPFLLAGATYATAHGAPHEAEMALSSGLPAMPVSMRGQALLALAEAHQAQGDWEKALTCLRELPADGPHGSVAHLLALRAEAFLGRVCEQAIQSNTAGICTIIRRSEDIHLRLLALSVGATLLTVCSSRHLADDLLSAAQHLPVSDLAPADALTLHTALAKLLYHNRRLDESEEHLKHAIAIGHETRIRNSDYFSAQTGLTALAAARGNYAGCLEETLRLYEEADQIGRRATALTACNNAATCLIRMGRYADAVAWATRVAPLPGDGIDNSSLREYNFGFASAFLGDRNAALRAAASLIDSVISDRPSLRQRWAFLGAADLLTLGGRPEPALECAARALDQCPLPIGDLGLAGRTARWVALLAVASQTTITAQGSLRAFLDLPLDAYDHIECLHALSIAGVWDAQLEQELQTRLGVLPSPVAGQVERLTMPVLQHLGFGMCSPKRTGLQRGIT